MSTEATIFLPAALVTPASATSAIKRTGPALTGEQRAAVSDRTGSGLLAANAGSGKTAVMVERFVEAVLRDDVPVGAILALTFTDKAAGELRERLRRRFADLGRVEEARQAEGAWVGTIHGFCARVLRSHSLAAGLDPGFEVMDEFAARRVANRAYERALDAFVTDCGPPALDLAAAYGPALRGLVLDAHHELRSRGQTFPRLAVPLTQPEPDSTALAAARFAAAAELASAKPGVMVARGLAALDACDSELASVSSGPVPFPGELDAATLGSGAAALKQPACADYRREWSSYRQACADHHARSAVALIAALLERFNTAYTEGKSHRSAVDFEDLELLVRDLLRADAGLRERWAQRYALIMVDEFQDTNRLQLDVLEALERDNLFAVGDEFQSIYGFRHADVTIFRDRRAALGPAQTRTLRVNFRSREELLDVINGAFAGPFGERFTPLVAGRADAASAAGTAGADGELRLFDPDALEAEAAVELLITDTRGWGEDAELEASIGLTELAEQPWRRAEARRVARRLREVVDGGRRQGDIVVLVRATASLRILEQALEDEGLTTYVVGGRGYWSQEQVRDGLAYLRALANPLDEEALLGVLASPFAGVGSDGLVLLARAARASHRGIWAQLREMEGADWAEELPEEARARLERFAAFFTRERAIAPRVAVEVQLERALAATGYDLAILARPDGERRLANLRKLMRLAREYERAEGRDLRAFLEFAATQELEAAREGEAPLESEGLDAIRLMTIHRAKGLEFGVVCVADLGREAARATDPMLVGPDGTVGLRLATLGGGKGVPALAHEALTAEKSRAEADEERRLFYVAMTRARDKLILAGGIDAARWPEAKPGAAPLTWVARALLGEHPQAVVSPEAPETLSTNTWDGRRANVRVHLLTTSQAGAVLAPLDRRTPPTQTVLPAVPTVSQGPVIGPGAERRSGPARLSYSSLGDYERCPYRFYLRRVLGLVDVPEPEPVPSSAPVGVRTLDPRDRGTLVHELLEDLDFRRPIAPRPSRVEALAAARRFTLSNDDVDDVIALVMAFARSPLCARLAAAGRSVQREAPFGFALDGAPETPLLTGFVDVLATERDGSVLVVDYKTDRLEPGDTPEAAVARAYATQRLVYALAALRAGAPRVEVAHCYLECPTELASAIYTAEDLPELAEALLALAEGVRAARYPVTSNPHRELCGTCPGRPALCSHPEELTLRPAHESDNSAPVRHRFGDVGHASAL